MFINDPKIFERQAHNPSFGALKRLLPEEAAKQLVDYYVPVNSYFPTPEMYDIFHSRLREALTYYPEQNEPLVEILSGLLGIHANCLVLANGSTELITWIDRLFLTDTLFTCIPTFGRWTDQPIESGKRVEHYLRQSANGFQIVVDEFVDQALSCNAEVIVICNPNNPTGALLPEQSMLELLDRLASTKLIVIDESFIDFSDEAASASMQKVATERENVIIVKSLGKCFGLHGSRMGYAATNPRLAKKIRESLPFWNINGVAEMILRVVGNYWETFQQSRYKVIQDRQYLFNGLRQIEGFTVYPSQANFVYTKVPEGINGTDLRNFLAREYGFIIRECANKIGSSCQYFRIAATPRASTDKLLNAISEGTRQL